MNPIFAWVVLIAIVLLTIAESAVVVMGILTTVRNIKCKDWKTVWQCFFWLFMSLTPYFILLFPMKILNFCLKFIDSLY